MAMPWLPSFVAKRIGKNLGKPSKSPLGFFVGKFLVKKNEGLEKNTVKLLNLEANHFVLEAGFGPGIGLEEACKYVSTGQVFGIEISDKMLADAHQRLRSGKGVGSGKVHLRKVSVENTHFPNDMFDRIFHTNCYYFWPCKESGAREMFRILKPKGLMLTGLNMAGLSVRWKRATCLKLQKASLYKVCLQWVLDKGAN